MSITTTSHIDQNFIAFSKPGDTSFKLAPIANSKIQKPSDILSDYDFIFAPFDNSNDSYLFQFSEVVLNGKFNVKSNEDFIGSPISKSDYLESCKDLVLRLQSGECDKVVFSKEKQFHNSDIDVYKIFLDLKNKYPNAFVYCLSHKDIGIWIGATPEVLLSQNGIQFSTSALAGTQRYSSDNPIIWSQKEIEEHLYIEQFVKERLDRLGINYQKSEIKNKRAGAVVHRESTFSFQLEDVQIQNVINTLHPGPAISGYPQEKAMSIINEIENYYREYYCGYLGSLDKGECDLYINLRCMKIYRDSFKLYLGGGITKDSNAESEWNETELKSKTLLDVMHKSITV